MKQEQEKVIITHLKTTVFKLPSLTPLCVEITTKNNERWIFGPGGDEW